VLKGKQAGLKPSPNKALSDAGYATARLPKKDDVGTLSENVRGPEKSRPAPSDVPWQDATRNFQLRDMAQIAPDALRA
jgi:hypothetical protein